MEQPDEVLGSTIGIQEEPRTIGNAQAMIEIVPYRPSWRMEFEQMAAPLRKQLGPLAVRIDHIGSTSIPGLAAKDVIDIQVTVIALAAPIEHRILDLGYTQSPHRTDHIPPGAPASADHWSKWLFLPGPEVRRTHVHVRVVGKPNQRYPILFRDYLRVNSRAAEAYERLKTALATLHADDTAAYSAVKDPACDIILEAAGAWATLTGWQPGPSDA